MIGETDEHGGWTVDSNEVVIQSEGVAGEIETATPGCVSVVAHPTEAGTVGVVIAAANLNGSLAMAISLPSASAHELALQILARCAVADA